MSFKVVYKLKKKMTSRPTVQQFQPNECRENIVVIVENTYIIIFCNFCVEKRKKKETVFPPLKMRESKQNLPQANIWQ